MSYIDREQLIDMFQQLAHDDWNQRVSTTWANAYSDATEMVRDIPSADVEPVRHGRWIEVDESENTYECSVCNEPWTLIEGTPLDNEMLRCPKCGAIMDEVSE